MTEVISFDLRLIQQDERGSELTFDTVLGARTSASRLGLTKLAALELLDKLHKCYGVRMLEAFKEADLYSTLLEYFEAFPYNDIALKLITNIIAYTLDAKAAKAAEKAAAAATESKRKGVPGLGLAWEEDKDEKAEDKQEDEDSEEVADDQQQKDALLIFLLFQTPLLDKITGLCLKQSRL